MPAAIALVDLLDERNVALHVRARKPETAVREIVQLLAVNAKIDNPQKFVGEVLARERTNPTITDHGVAFPHARTDLVEEITLGIGRSRAGILFGNGQRAHLIFVIGVPRQLVNDYLVVLGTLARIVSDDLTRAALMQAETARQFTDVLKSA
jgi:mannitol/fructose-specific phosphotransferase system IIA component (Ntr-type)